MTSGEKNKNKKDVTGNYNRRERNMLFDISPPQKQVKEKSLYRAAKEKIAGPGIGEIYATRRERTRRPTERTSSCRRPPRQSKEALVQ